MDFQLFCFNFRSFFFYINAKLTYIYTVTTLEGIQKMENLEVKLDSFSSSKSIYVGYRKYNTRVKSFEQNNTWSEDKKKEFSTYGFLYGGKICGIYIAEIKIRKLFEN